MLRAFKECDIFRKLPPEHREIEVPTSGGASFVRLMTWLAVGWLAFTEFWSFLTPAWGQRFDLDMHSSLNASAARKIRVLLNVTVHDFPCVDLSLDYQDVMGTRAVDVKTTMFKQRLHPNGSLVEAAAMKNDPKVAEATAGGRGASIRGNSTGNASCMTCYGALPEGECCNTCADVLYAYRLKRWALPRIESIEQCKNDGSERSAYQPPQILRLSDYSSDDFMPRFARLGNLSGSSNEPRISTPFKWNLTFDSSKPYSLSSVSGARAFPSVSLNLSAFKSFYDEDDEGWLGDDESYGIPRKSKPWPACVYRNVMVHGYDLGEALIVNLSKHGAKSGCWNDDCTATDKFQSSTMEECAQVCDKVPECKWWTFGTEDGVSKCWIRAGRHDRQRRYGFSSGPRACFDNGTSSAVTADASSTAAPAAAPTPAVEESSSSTLAPAVADGMPRRLSSFDDDDYYRGSGLSLSRSFLPMFSADTEESRMRKEQKGESCRLHGFFDTNKVPGNFHIGTHGYGVPSYLSYWDDPAPPTQNMRHTINRLAFVEVENEELLNAMQALDGFESPQAFTFQYYVTITPATIKESNGVEKHGYQFRAGSFVTNELIGPAVFWRMDIDAIRVTYYTEEVRWSRFLVNICAVVGGCIAITTMLGQMLDNAADIVLHKD